MQAKSSGGALLKTLLILIVLAILAVFALAYFSGWSPAVDEQSPAVDPGIYEEEEYAPAAEIVMDPGVYEEEDDVPAEDAGSDPGVYEDEPEDDEGR